MAQEFKFEVFDLLSPRSLSTKKPGESSLAERIRTKLIDKSTTYKAVQDDIKSYFQRKNVSERNDIVSPSIDNFAKNFHAISSKYNVISDSADFNDNKYWQQRGDTSVGSNATIERIFGDVFKSALCEISIFVSKDPYLSPATAGTEDIELFLNYTPPIIANSLTPYLDVEFLSDVDRNSSQFKYLSTPSTLRFLLGSIPISKRPMQDLSQLRFKTVEDDDTTLQKKDDDKYVRVKTHKHSRITGMDLFLSPQSMNDLSKGGNKLLPPKRIVPVEPFLPFASIIDFDVQVRNAGAGAMAHKTAKLNLEIYDRARISEMSEFFRGSEGFRTVKVWTSYGWYAGQFNDPKQNEYADFINKNMRAEDCWQIVNTQFQIEQSGKTKVSLDLVGQGVTKTQKTSIKIADKLQANLNYLSVVLEEIKSMSRSVLSQPLGPDARITQILNAAAAGSTLPGDLKGEALDKMIAQTIGAYANSAGIDPAEAKKLIDQTTNVLNPTKYKAGLAVKRAESIRDSIVNIPGYDPFLAGATSDPNYFSEDLIKEVEYFFTPPPLTLTEEAKQAEEGDKDKQQNQSTDAENIRPAIQLAAEKKVMSFGKLFCNLALPAFIEANTTELKLNSNAEVQVLFYALNDECGPVSGASLAEFPIDMERLAYTIDDVIKIKNKVDLTIEEFLKIVINSQFTDERSIGYGKLSRHLFAPYDKDKPGPAKQEKNELYESALAEWHAKYPVFAKPIVEMLIETVPIYQNVQVPMNGTSASGRPNITRIHLYDKQNNPRKLFTKIVDMSGKLFVGEFNESEMRKRLSANPDEAKAIDDLLNALKIAESSKDPNQIKAVNEQIAQHAGVTLKTPDGRDSRIPITKTLFGSNGIRNSLQKLAPNLLIGTNGSLIHTANLQSKTDGLMAAANLVKIMKKKEGGSSNSVEPPGSGIEGQGGLPLRTVPAQLSLTMQGCPSARLYQQYFIDLGTGTSLDNLYTCTALSHKVSQGKFETAMTFAYTDGYGKFSAPPSIVSILSNYGKFLNKAKKEAEAAEAAKDKKSPPVKPSTKATPKSSSGKEKPSEPVVPGEIQADAVVEDPTPGRWPFRPIK